MNGVWLIHTMHDSTGRPAVLPLLHSVLEQDKLNTSYAELSGAFKTSLEGLARTVQDLHAIIK